MSFVKSMETKSSRQILFCFGRHLGFYANERQSMMGYLETKKEDKGVNFFTSNFEEFKPSW